ncbi:MAG: gliding motility lipoprotein GldD [Bacteroidota bacterium]|nr:gliding motility lipoprotein GldD [Bacteroidota bacterium]
MGRVRVGQFALICTFILFISCEKTYVPKPKGYHRIDLPKHEYQPLLENHPYKFEYSKSAVVTNHKSAQTEPDWIDILYKEHRAVVQITYKPLYKEKNKKDKEKLLYELINDTYKLTSKHEVKASGIEESVVRSPSGKIATLFELEGDVPSQFQFYVTDTNNHFFRGALYFRTSTKNDSLSPIIEYIKIDMMHLINTLDWKKEIKSK